MKRYLGFLTAVAMAIGCEASWYWPFGDDEDEPSQPRLSVLLEDASALIDDASDLAAAGKTREAVEKYKEVLKELDRVEMENPERVAAPEFATVRNKRAYVNAAIDSLLLTHAQTSARTVAVSDTTGLEERLAEEKKGASDNRLKVEGKRLNGGMLNSVSAVETKEKDHQPSTSNLQPPTSNLQSQPAQLPQRSQPSRKELAMADLAKKDFAAARISIAEMLVENASDPTALNLQAVMEMMQGNAKAAEATLNYAIEKNPRNHYAYYNMARLHLQVKPPAKEVARRYYKTGRDVGGPVDQKLEKALK